MTGLTLPVECITLIADELNTPRHVKRTARIIAHDIQDTNPAVWGRAPHTVAAACIYVAGLTTGEHLTQASIADAAGCARITIQEIYPHVADHVERMEANGDHVTVEITTQ